MLLNDDEVQQRIESPVNLLNRLRTSLNKTTQRTNIPMLPPKAEDVISNLEDKIIKTTATTKARQIMIKAMDELDRRMPEVDKPERLAVIAREMAGVVNHQEKKDTGFGNGGSQIIVYAPQVLSLENYNIIDVSE